ncbi:MAG: hypothetical protein AAGC57_06220 [Pseudomonadota bacterium]
MAERKARMARLCRQGARWGVLGPLLALMAACAGFEPTPYQPAIADGAHGFRDQQIEANRYEVRFVGNPQTAAATVERYLLYRSAEVTVAAGADWFRFVERKIRPEPTALGPETGAAAETNGLAEVQLPSAPDALAAVGAVRLAKKGKRRARGHGKRYRRGYRHGYRRSGVRFGFFFGGPYWPYYGPYYGPYWGRWGYVPYAVRPRPPSYEAVAEILVFEGEKPADDAEAYAAAEVVERLRPSIRFAPPPD